VGSRGNQNLSQKERTLASRPQTSVGSQPVDLNPSHASSLPSVNVDNHSIKRGVLRTTSPSPPKVTADKAFPFKADREANADNIYGLALYYCRPDPLPDAISVPKFLPRFMKGQGALVMLRKPRIPRRWIRPAATYHPGGTMEVRYSYKYQPSSSAFSETPLNTSTFRRL